jgi:hypothetical protein
MLCPATNVSFCAGSDAKYCIYYSMCSGNGRCLSLRDAAILQDYVNFYQYSVYNDWDADMIHGCACDPGWEGPDCSLRSCPKGDDPLTSGVDEVQLIDCKCTNCTGSINLKFKGRQTKSISYNANANLVKLSLKQLLIIDDLAVDIVNSQQLCSSAGSVTRITFKLPQGPQPTIQISTSSGLAGVISIRSKGAASVISSSVLSYTGTREYSTCSNHGTCDTATGICSCYQPYNSSDGFGNEGTRGDCGYRITASVSYESGAVTTSCPYVDEQICSGNGGCSAGTCICNGDYGMLNLSYSFLALDLFFAFLFLGAINLPITSWTCMQ